MSRLRRPFLYDRFLFVTVKLLPSRSNLNEREFARLAISLAPMRQKHHFLLTAWVLLPDHWHAIIYPPYPLTISAVFKAVKVSSTISINVNRQERSGKGGFSTGRCGLRIDRVRLPAEQSTRI